MFVFELKATNLSKESFSYKINSNNWQYKILNYWQFINSVIFEKCENCYKMPYLPQAAFAVRKIREKNERQVAVLKKVDEKRPSSTRYDNNQGYTCLAPVKYNEKLMKSIWGNYNRNSPHNFKKNNGASFLGEQQQQQQVVSKDLAKTFAFYITCDEMIDHAQLEDACKFFVA